MSQIKRSASANMHLRNEKKDSIVETDSSMGSNGSLKKSQIQDSSAFDKLLMSSDTVKLTSTPDRLKTIEVKKLAIKLEAKSAVTSASKNNLAADEAVKEMSLEDEIFNAVSGSPVIASKKKKQETYWEFLKNTGPEDMLATGTRARPSNAFMTGDHEVSNEPVPPVPALPVTPSTLGSENSLTGTHSLGTHQDTSRVNSVARSINYEANNLSPSSLRRTMTASKSVPDTLSAMLDSPSSSTASTQPLQSKLTVSSTKSAGTRPVSAVDPDDRKPMSQNPSVKKSNLSTRPASSVDPDAGDDDELFGAKGRKKNDQMSLADFLRETEPPPMISSIGSQQMLNEKSGSSSGKKKNNGIMNFLGNLSKSRNELSPSPSSKNNESLFGTAKSDSSRDLQSAGSYAPSIANSTSTSSSNLEGMTIDKKKYSMIQQKGPTPSPLQQQNSNTTNGSHSNTNISNNAGQVASANTTIPQQQQPLAAAPSNSNMPRSSSSNNKENMTSNAAPSNNTTSPGATPVLAPIVATSPTQTRRASFTEMKPMTLMTASNAPPVPPVPVQYGERVARVPSAGSLTSLGGPPGRSKSVNRVQQLIGSQSDLSQGSRGSNNTPPSSRRTRPRPTLNLPESLPDIYAAPLEKVFKQLIQINEKFAVVMDIKGEARKTSMSSLNTPGSPTSSSSIPRSQRKLIKLPSATSSPVGGAPQDIGSPVYNVRRHVFSQTENNVCMESDTQTEDLSGEEEAEECDDVYGKNAKPKALLSEHQSTSTSTATGQWSASKSTSRETSPLQHTLSSVAAVVTLATTEASTSTMAETVEKETTVSSCTSCEDSKRKLERLEIDHFARGLVGKMIQRVIIQKVVPKRKIAQTQTSPPAELVETELQTMPIQFKVEEDDMLKEKALHELANQNNQLLDEITSLRMEVARERASRDSLSIEKDTMSKRFEALAKISLGVLRSEHEKRYEVEVDLWEKTS